MSNTKKIAFLGFWPGFNQEDNFLINPIREKYPVEVVCADEADYVFYSMHSDEHLFVSDDKIKIYYTQENIVPDFNLCDYAIGFEYMNFGDRFLRIPGYMDNHFVPDIKLAEKKMELPEGFSIAKDKPDFCSFTISNPNRASKVFIELCEKLEQYKKVDSGGRWRNNVGGPVADKMAFDRTHKFSIAFENSSHPGYTTEKIAQAFAAQAIPIYWGDPTIVEQFNPKAFINVSDFESMDEVVELVKKIDADDALYLSYIREPLYLEGQKTSEEYEEEMKRFIQNVVSQPLKEAQRRNRVFWGMNVLTDARRNAEFRQKQDDLHFMAKRFWALLKKEVKKWIKL